MKIYKQTDTQCLFWCPGCDEAHSIDNTRWQVSGTEDRPTISPSVLATCGHLDPKYDGNGCWCTYNEEHPDNPSKYKCYRCHSFVRDGQIEFLTDCSHALAGKTVPMVEVEDHASWLQ